MTQNWAFPFVFSLFILLCTGCNQDGPLPVSKTKTSTGAPVQEPSDPTENEPLTPLEIGGKCKTDNDCPNGETCFAQPKQDCKSNADCPAGNICGEKEKACLTMECTNACTKAIGRYGFNGRNLLRRDMVPGGVRNWVWGSPCSAKGLCKPQVLAAAGGPAEEHCIAQAETDCQTALVCSWFGQCSLDYNVCVARQAADCQASKVCKQHGRCTPKDGICTATDNADCEASTMCKKLNYCAVNAKGLCRVPEGETVNFKSMHGTKTLPKAEEESLAPVEKAPDGKTIAELHAERDALKATEVIVRGKVVKFTPNILGRNWIHLQDGSGNPAEKNHDITITSTDVTTVGSIATFKGTLVTDQNFGSGYFYSILIEKAALTP